MHVMQVSGWAVFGAGVWLHIYRETFLYAVLLRDNPTDPVLVLDDVALILIIVGGIIVTVSFLGCWGACTESVCFLAFVSTFSQLPHFSSRPIYLTAEVFSLIF